MTLLLKPCPFCGSEAESRDIRHYSANGDVNGKIIRCPKCHIATNPVYLVKHNYLAGVSFSQYLSSFRWFKSENSAPLPAKCPPSSRGNIGLGVLAAHAVVGYMY